MPTTATGLSQLRDQRSTSTSPSIIHEPVHN
jgi:hypothetical protein